jgi:hypothetical protein
MDNNCFFSHYPLCFKRDMLAHSLDCLKVMCAMSTLLCIHNIQLNHASFTLDPSKSFEPRQLFVGRANSPFKSRAPEKILFTSNFLL